MKTVIRIDINSAQNSSLSSATAHFNEHFELVVANTPKLRAEVYKLRYKVYCQELGYEREEDCPNGLEQDIYDRHSIHCLLLHRKSRTYAGCVRLVLPKVHKSGANLPFEWVFTQTSQLSLLKEVEAVGVDRIDPAILKDVACGRPAGFVVRPEATSGSCGGFASIRRAGTATGVALSIQELKNLPQHSYGEVSRLAVTAEFRKRSGEPQTPHGVSTEQYQAAENERRYFPLIALGLYLAATAVALELGLDSALTLMEPRLARHLRRFGIRFRQIGELVEFHGQRGLFQISQDAALNDMDANTYELFQGLRPQIQQSLKHYPMSLSDCQAA